MGNSLTELCARIQPFRWCPMGLHLALMCAWDAVVGVTRVEALFPFSEADVPSNRSRKSFVFWQCQVGGPAVWWLASEFELPVGDWPGALMGLRAGNVPHPRHLLLLPPVLLAPHSPYAPFFPCADCHTLFTTAWNVTHNTGYLLEYRSDNWGILFDARRASWLFGDRLWRLPICHDSGFACAFLPAGRHIFCNGR